MSMLTVLVTLSPLECVGIWHFLLAKFGKGRNKIISEFLLTLKKGCDFLVPVKRNSKQRAGKAVTASISMPPELWGKVKGRLAKDPELDFSKYVRRLLRQDLESQAA